ncbi:MAG TPA: hypothetical protein PLI95_21680 [Polyangiaceae bacterium]|nr:hypothetical protein [Polyangiaceae bacterium]
MQRGPRAIRHAWLLAAALAAATSVTQPSWAVGVSPESATAIQREQAQARFVRGRTHFDKRGFDKALEEFRASHDIVSSPNTRLMIARCLREMGRHVEAYAEFGRTAIEAKELERSDRRYQQAAQSAASERKDLEPKLGFLALEIRNPGPDTEVRVAGEQIRRAAWAEPAPVIPGATTIEVVTPGSDPVSKRVEVAAGERKSLSIDAKGGASTTSSSSDTAVVSGSTTGGMRTWAYVAGGVGLAGLATFGLFGAMANSSHEELEGLCPNGQCPPGAQKDIDAGKRQQRIANIGLGVGLVGLATGVTLFVLSKPSKGKAGASVRLAPGYVGIAGRM